MVMGHVSYPAMANPTTKVKHMYIWIGFFRMPSSNLAFTLSSQSRNGRASLRAQIQNWMGLWQFGYDLHSTYCLIKYVGLHMLSPLSPTQMCKILCSFESV